MFIVLLNKKNPKLSFLEFFFPNILIERIDGWLIVPWCFFNTIFKEINYICPQFKVVRYLLWNSHLLFLPFLFSLSFCCFLEARCLAHIVDSFSVYQCIPKRVCYCCFSIFQFHIHYLSNMDDEAVAVFYHPLNQPYHILHLPSLPFPIWFYYNFGASSHLLSLLCKLYSQLKSTVL